MIDLAAGAPTVQSAQFSNNLPGGGSPTLSTSPGGGGTAQSPTIVNPSGFLGHWVTITADGGDIGYVTGRVSGDVSGGNAPALATTGGVGTAGACQRIFSGQSKDFYVTADERFLGVVSNATTTLRISKSSR